MKIIFYIAISLIIISCAAGIGVAPSRTEIFYQPLGEKEITFRIINNELKDMNLNLIVKGDLAQYITLSQEKIHVAMDEFESTVTYKIKFPAKLEPGLKTCEIWVVESADNAGGNRLQANIGVIHKLYVQVAYPEEYIEGMLFIGETKPNEATTFSILLTNVGSKDLSKIKGQILIRGPNGEGVAKILTNEISLKTKEKSKLTASWIANTAPGTYHAQAIIEYDNKILVLEKDFDVGEPLLDIEALRVGPFKLGTIARFDITLKNMWNQEIKDVFGVTEITDKNGALVNTYKTSSVDVPAEGKKDITSFWDTRDVSPGEFLITIKTQYLGRIREKIYELTVEQDKIKVNSLSGEAVARQPVSQNTQENYIIWIIVLIFTVIVLKLVLDFMVRIKKVRVAENPELRRIIKEKLKEGFSKTAIIDNLLDKGYSKEIIEKEMLKAEDEDKIVK